MRTIVFEVCAESVEASLAAREGGAHRIELCAALSEGGVTPSHGLIREVVERSGLPVHVMIRPRGGDFVYSDEEFRVMRRDLEHACTLGVAGFVFGLLHGDRSVDMGRTAELVRMAGLREVTFHRAFDHAIDIAQALEDVIQAGCGRVLTSGGASDVETGASSLARLVKQAAGRIEIAVGGGLRLENAAALARSTGARHFHGSLRRFLTEAAPEGEHVLFEDPDPVSAKVFVDSRDVRAMIENLSLA
ncbi:copper homeostasis protein CutC [Granulicella arctica]|uniref:copper homeostasis protein CutC n=1 Tax=Granulicella arctica TaxID=940613 RepID=UPI0021E06BE8|nr:copper homeostasis protein CutC [Granulicella arctica]